MNITDKCGKTALFDAVLKGSIQCTELLLKAGADVNIRGSYYCPTALFEAVRYASVECTDLLLKAGTDMSIKDDHGRTVLFVASPKCTHLLLKAGADVNIRDENSRTALFEAVSQRSVQYTEQLLKGGADVNISDKDGRTALFDAVRNSVQCTDLLLKAGADVNIKDKYGETALFDGVSQGSVQCTDLLLKAGADVNVTNRIGRTVLFLNTFFPRPITTAVLNSMKLILRELIKVNVRDNYGSNALTLHLNYIGNSSTGPEYIKFAMLLLSAGETLDKDGRIRLLRLFNQKDDVVPVEASEYRRTSAEISLMNICRETIRKHLLQMSQVNLFVRVPRLPRLMTSYLLYDVTLDHE